jgi:hypothetical protein
VHCHVDVVRRGGELLLHPRERRVAARTDECHLQRGGGHPQAALPVAEPRLADRGERDLPRVRELERGRRRVELGDEETAAPRSAS